LIQDQEHYPGLKWTSPINEFLRDDFVLEDDHATTHTTIEDALSHRSGLPRHDSAWGVLGETASSVVKRLRYLPMTAEPRTTFQYCNLMYGVVTDLLETLTGLKLETILREKFWDPLGMASTSFGGFDTQSNLARGYYWNPDKNGASTGEGFSTPENGYVPEHYLNISGISGAGAITSSVNDYALWVKAFLDTANAAKPRNTSSPITYALYRDVLTPRTMVLPPLIDSYPGFITPQLYALGWISTSVVGHTIVGHGGSLPAFGTSVIFLPDDDYGVVVMGNTAITSNIVGNLITVVLLKQKLGLNIEESASAKATLLAAFSDLDMRQDMHHINNEDVIHKPYVQQPGAAQSKSPPAEVAKLPLPGDIGDYAGLYTHPAYGMINFTVSTSDAVDAKSASSALSHLYGIPTPMRAWRYALELHHVTNTLFTCKLMTQHGMGSEVIWSQIGSSRAVFKFGLTSDEVETLGIELDWEMVEAAKRKGGKYWEEGMIWFDKV
jgi:CubicO group peptidase (beta-lactamase class C family)